MRKFGSLFAGLDGLLDERGVPEGQPLHPPAGPPARRGHDPPATQPPGPSACTAGVAARPRLNGRHTRVHPQRPRGHPGRRPPRAPSVLPVYVDPVRPPNNARFIFLSPHAAAFFRRWDEVAGGTAATLRSEAGRHLHDRRLTDLIGELSTRSEVLCRRWAARNARMHPTGVKLLHPPVVGDPDPPFKTFQLPDGPSQFLPTYTAAPHSPWQETLNLLANWAATSDNIARSAPADDSQPADSGETPD